MVTETCEYLKICTKEETQENTKQHFIIIINKQHFIQPAITNMRQTLKKKLLKTLEKATTFYSTTHLFQISFTDCIMRFMY